MLRIDSHPTHVLNGYGVRSGTPYPFGATRVAEGINFSVYSRHASYCVLVLYRRGQPEPFAEFPFRGLYQKANSDSVAWAEFRIGNVFCMTVLGLDHEDLEYGFRMDGAYPRVGRGEPAHHRFDRSRVLLDPYARGIGGRNVWGTPPNWLEPYPHRARVICDDFDWESDRPPEIALQDLVIYEAHVRGFTRHPSSGVRHPGTFDGLREKIPYLKELGVNCIELMPIFEFDEFEHSKRLGSGEMLMNYWGYSTLGFFAPKAGYAASGRAQDATMVADELKSLVKSLHAHGMEIILDVVFNHTAEGNEHGPTISFKGIDNATYYMLTPEGYYFNFSGTGNTFNCNNPVVRNMVVDALRYWASEYHVDGFRFDLASILGRDPWGAPMNNPPLLESLAFDPILARCKLIAEAWDAGGLYQVGSFPAYGRWAEWNGKYRDCARRFLKGDCGMAGEMIHRLLGSPDLYPERGTTASINFITCHDGFTLADLVSYNDKHNESNGEDNHDGSNDNHSWNCGWEGPTHDPGVRALRNRQSKNALLMLMTSQGVPMILMGDEIGRTQGGNNNMYCHDNEASWMDWSLLEDHGDLFRFFKHAIAFRHRHPVLRYGTHLSGCDRVGSGLPDCSFHGTQAWKPEPGSHTLAFMLCGRHARDEDDSVYVAMNMHWDSHDFELPWPGAGRTWHVFADTARQSPDDICEPGREGRFTCSHVRVEARSVVILVSR